MLAKALERAAGRRPAAGRLVRGHGADRPITAYRPGPPAGALAVGRTVTPVAAVPEDALAGCAGRRARPPCRRAVPASPSAGQCGPRWVDTLPAPLPARAAAELAAARSGHRVRGRHAARNRG